MRWWYLGLALVSATPAFAQDSGGPAQNGNVYDGTSHQPSAAGVHSQEKAAGIAPPPAQQKQLDNNVEQLDKQVQKNAQDAGAKAAACAKDPSNC